MGVLVQLNLDVNDTSCSLAAAACERRVFHLYVLYSPGVRSKYVFLYCLGAGQNAIYSERPVVSVHRWKSTVPEEA